MKRIVVLLCLLSVLWPGTAQTFIRSLPTSTNLTSATKVPVDDATYGTRAVTLQNLLASTATNATLLAAITNVVEDTATSLLGNKLDATNGVAVRLSGSLTNVTANGITLTANGISAAVNLTAGDLQDLSSFGVFDATVPTRVRVLRDDSGYILGSGRWYSKATTDTRTPDGITIIQPIDVLSEASPGRWVLEGYEQ